MTTTISASIPPECLTVDDMSAVMTSVPDGATMAGLDPEQIAAIAKAIAEHKKNEKEAKRIERENKKREAQGLPPLGELSAEHADKVADIMAAAEPEYIMAFLCVEKPHTLLQIITHMEKSEYPWRKDASGKEEDDE
jgi:hypothetical protein